MAVAKVVGTFMNTRVMYSPRFAFTIRATVDEMTSEVGHRRWLNASDAEVAGESRDVVEGSQ